MAGRRKIDQTIQDVKDGDTKRAATVHIPAEAPGMPEYFKASETLPGVWREVVTEFDRINILARTDGALMETVCILLDQFRRMTIFLIKEKETYTCVTKNGTRQFKRPEYDIRKDTMLRLQSVLIEMGATPASRGKVSSLLQADLFKAGADGNNAWNGFNGAKSN